MKRTLLATALLATLGSGASAETIGVSMAAFDDMWLTVLRNGMDTRAQELEGVTLQMEDAQGDIARQLDQINNFIAAGVDAIIVNAVDTSATQTMSDAAEKAGIPLVYANRMPVNVDSLPESQSWVGSDEYESGTLQAFEVCKMLLAEGKSEGARAYIMIGLLENQSAQQRTKDVHDVLSMDMCKFITLIDEQSARYLRTDAQNLMTNWLATGESFDAIFSNNDEMAIGAVQAMKAAGVDPSEVVIGGVDATQDGLAALRAGDIDVTVFQDAPGMGAESVDTALQLARGEDVPRKRLIPFELVTRDNLAQYETRN